MKFTPKHGFVIVRLHWHNPTGVTIGDDVGNGGTAANGGLGRRHSGISVNQRDRGNHSNVVTFNSSTHPNGDIEHGGGGKEGMFCGSCCGFGGVSSAMPSSYLQSSSFLSSQLYNHHHMDGQPDPRRRNSMSSISSFYHSWYNHSHSSPTSTAATKTTINVKHTDSKGTKASLSNSEHSISTTARRANRYMKQVQANNPILDIMHHELSHAKAAGSLVISIIDSGPGVSEVSLTDCMSNTLSDSQSFNRRIKANYSMNTFKSHLVNYKRVKVLVWVSLYPSLLFIYMVVILV